MPDKRVFPTRDEWPGVAETAKMSTKVPIIKHHPNGSEVKMTHRARDWLSTGDVHDTCQTEPEPDRNLKHKPSRKRQLGLETSKKEVQILAARPQLYSLPQ